MTDYEQDIAVAKTLGWQIVIAPTGGYYVLRHPNGTLGTDHYILKETAFTRIPKYGSDLNACHEMEKFLTDKQLYRKFLYLVVIEDPQNKSNEPAWATAPQRREAFLRVLGLWTP